jgi:nucleotide-binding universal stress UspA family protein
MLDVATTFDADKGLVVGHDGSAPAADAVQWAARLAARLGVPLHVVRAWVISSAPRPESAEGSYVPPITDYEAAVQQRLEQDVAGLDLPEGCQVRCHVVHGSSGRRLVECSENAEMLVVGTRGAGGFLGLRFGSTADQVVLHATCPVVVVPVDGDDESADLDAQGGA